MNLLKHVATSFNALYYMERISLFTWYEVNKDEVDMIGDPTDCKDGDNNETHLHNISLLFQGAFHSRLHKPVTVHGKSQVTSTPENLAND